jgi:predicted RNA binding protein YcfA (HicA-like mRNA interferase family)
LRKLLEDFGFELNRSKGGHHSFIARIAGRKTLLVIPYRQPLKRIYVEQALAPIDQIELEQDDE